MNNKISHVFFYVSNLIFSVLILISFLASCLSNNIHVGVFNRYGATTFVTFFVIVCFFLLWLITKVRDNKIPLMNAINNHLLIFSVVSFLVVILLQLIFILFVHPEIGWDVGALKDGLIYPNSPEIKAYFSINYNNIPSLLIFKSISVLCNSTSFIFFDIFNVIFVDISIIINIVCIILIDKKHFKLGVILNFLFLLIFPYIIVPYSDTFVMPFVSITILGIILILKVNNIFFINILFAMMTGVSSAIMYLIKPSSIILLIAFVLLYISLLISPIYKKTINSYLFGRTDKTTYTRKQAGSILKFGRLKLTLLLVLIIFSMTGTYKYITNNIINNQKIVRVDKNRKIPIIHFVNIGANPSGGYDATTAQKMASISNYNDRVAFSKKELKKKLKERGIFGNIKFYLFKHIKNTSDGSFAWGKEGHFFKYSDGTVKNSNWLQEKISNYVYIYGKNIGDFRFFAQLFWIICLLLITFDYKNNAKIIHFLRISLTGVMLFLIIFEGGRSRYLIQSMPEILILAPLTGSESIKSLKIIIDTVWLKFIKVLKINV